MLAALALAAGCAARGYPVSGRWRGRTTRAEDAGAAAAETLRRASAGSIGRGLAPRGPDGIRPRTVRRRRVHESDSFISEVSEEVRRDRLFGDAAPLWLG